MPPLSGIDQKAKEVLRSIAEFKALTETSKKQLKQYLVSINQISGDEGPVAQRISAIEVYKWFVAKEKALYQSLNTMRAGPTAYIGFFWAPTSEEVALREVLQAHPTTDFKEFKAHNITPPTYIKTNDFTWSFQQIVDTYGIPMYKEVNPAIFACVTFPFLFGVMFGDMAHGSLMLLLGIFLCLINDKLKGTSLEAAGQLRYLLVLMGIFATYMGFIYNEFFAIPIEFFGSCYESEPYNETAARGLDNMNKARFA